MVGGSVGKWNVVVALVGRWWSVDLIKPNMEISP